MSLVAALRAYLAPRAATGERVTYRQVAQDLAVPGPGSIQIVAQALEIMMQQDVLAGRPLLAALVVSRVHNLPAAGFFQTAQALGFDAADPAAFHAAQIAALGKPAPLP